MPEYIEELMETYNVSSVPALAMHQSYDTETKTVMKHPNFELNTQFSMVDLRKYLRKFARKEKLDGDELLSQLQEMKLEPRPVLFQEYDEETRLNIDDLPTNQSQLIYFTTLDPKLSLLSEFSQLN